MVVKGHLKGYVKRIYDTLETGVVLQFGWTPSGKPELVSVFSLFTYGAGKRGLS